MELGSRLKDKHGEKVSIRLSGHLLAGEDVHLVTRTSSLRPQFDRIVVTNLRVLGLSMTGTSEGPQVEVFADQVEGLAFAKSAAHRNRVVVSTANGDVAFGDAPRDDNDLLARHIEGLAEASSAANAATARQAREEASADAEVADATFFDGTTFAGESASGRALKEVKRHSEGGEPPWLIIGSGMYGVLAAFDDRLMIAKVGAMTGFMSGATGGGRVTVFPYTDITGIEYNAGFTTAVLEVLTPSYSGTANKDFWKSGENSSPASLSNTLPLMKPVYKKVLPHLNELRRRIAEAKRPQVTVVQQGSSDASSGLSEELRQLGELHRDGILDDDEFRAAKQSLIDRR